MGATIASTARTTAIVAAAKPATATHVPASQAAFVAHAAYTATRAAASVCAIASLPIARGGCPRFGPRRAALHRHRPHMCAVALAPAAKARRIRPAPPLATAQPNAAHQWGGTRAC